MVKNFLALGIILATPSRGQSSFIRINSRQRKNTRKHQDARIRLQYELLEPRHLLAGDLDVGVQALAAPSTVGIQALAATAHELRTESPKGYDSNAGVQASAASAIPTAPITWFETYNDVPRVALGSLTTIDPILDAGVAGPLPLATGEWIVQLTADAAGNIRKLSSADSVLDSGHNDFTVISGLGAKGLILVRGHGVSEFDIEQTLRDNANVASFSVNQLITGQDTTPNDTDFVRGAMPSLTTIGLPAAWEESIGSLSTVVGVLDTGIDLAHRDLYLNIWLNQGEIPSRFLDDVGNKLADIDGDGLITFYDLNNATRSNTAPYLLTVGGFANGPNAEFVKDLNGNGYIDGLDILADPLWADGRDTDGNGEVDDFFGVNFRGGVDRNNPTDGQGHGTHIAGTIGAIGGNGTGVTGINWQTSLMALRILDDNNQGDTGAAIKAVNYTRDIRERYTVNNAGRVTQGANVRVLNNSWGQPGGYESSLETAIQEIGDAGVLFVAASGNGNFLGQGVDNDRTPFYPASHDSPNVIAVAASNLDDTLATFSNFGSTSVDIAAPGVGIRSTELGGGYGTRNGTSMATPHVAGTATLIFSIVPAALLSEVKAALLSTADRNSFLSGSTVSGGRLNAERALNANVFAPTARLASKQDITKKGGSTSEVVIQYFHRSGIDATSIGDDDLLILRKWGPAESVVAKLKAGSIIQGDQTLQATYLANAPGGAWDSLDFGDYEINTLSEKIKARSGQAIRDQAIGSFNVRILDDPDVLYADRLDDSLESGTLRSAIIEANLADQPKTIILNLGTYAISIPHQADPESEFPEAPPNSFSPVNRTGWSNERSGDFDVTGSITIIGNQNDFTVIDGKGIDRVFKVHPSAFLDLQRVTVSGGRSPSDQGGGGILSAGKLKLESSIVRKNVAIGAPNGSNGSGGGVAAWYGQFESRSSWIDQNKSNYGAHPQNLWVELRSFS